MRFRILYSNNLIIADAKYEVLEDMIACDIIMQDKKDLQMRDFLLGVKHEGVKLLTTAE